MLCGFARAFRAALDIITNGRTGMLATTDTEYADAMAALTLPPDAE